MLRAENIITVTQGGILLKDQHGMVHWLDFRACRDRWLQQLDLPAKMDKRYVAFRWEQATQASVTFFTQPPLELHFPSTQERNAHLLSLMARFGWFTVTEDHPAPFTVS